MPGFQCSQFTLGLYVMGIMTSMTNPYAQNETTLSNSTLVSFCKQNVSNDTNYWPEQDLPTGLYKFRFMEYSLIGLIISLPGIVCNVINIHVLRQQDSSSSTIRYFIGLSIFDLLYLLTVMCNWLLDILETFYSEYFVEFMVAQKNPWLVRFLPIAFGRASNVLIVVISVDRFVAVKFPLLVKMSPLSRHAAKVTIGVAMFVTCLTVPLLLQLEYVQVFGKFNNETISGYQTSEFGVANKEFYKNYTYAILIILRLMPVLSVLVLNAGIIFTLKTPNTLNMQTSDNNRELKQNRVTRMLLAISALFLLCVSPGLINSMLGNFLPAYHPSGKYRHAFKIATTCATALDITNSATNFFIYIITSGRFRSIFLTTFCKKQQKTMMSS